mgnify:CR=1 FL=1
MLRSFKVVAALLIGLIGSLAFLNNLFNINSALFSVSAVISAPEQPYYKIFGPTFPAAWQAWLGLVIIMAGELLAGVLGLVGAARLWKNRNASAADFQLAKSLAVAGGAMGIVVWYGFFVIFGDLYFNMWQTEIGLGSVNGAFKYGTVCAVLLFFIAMRDD